MLSYMKVMHYGLMFPKARHGDAALIWNALCGKWIYRSAVKKSGLGADNHFWFDLVRSSKPLPVWMFRTSGQHRWDRRCLKILPKNRKSANAQTGGIRKSGFHILIIITTGVAPDYIALLPTEAGRHLSHRSPCGQVIILIYLLPGLQLLLSDHLCSFIIRDGAL